MTQLEVIRDEIAGDLEGVMQVLTTVPNKLTPPVSILVPDNPYIVPATGNEGATFDKPWNVNVNLLVIYGKGDFSYLTHQVDQDVEDVIGALKDYPITEITPLSVIEIGGIEYTGFVIAITHNTSL